MPDRNDAARTARAGAALKKRLPRVEPERGVLVIHTGAGKGKSTAAFGLAARALGHGMKVAVVQFIKSADTGEERFFQKAPGLIWRRLGEGFTWVTRDRDRDRRAARRAWAAAAIFLKDPAVGLVVLDELNVALSLGQLPLAPVLAALRGRPPRQHAVATGRGAPPALIKLADTVTDHRAVKHAFAAGVRAQPGVEW